MSSLISLKGTMFNKVLLLSASSGAGHVRAAQALERAVAELKAAREVHHVDALEYADKTFRNFYSKAYLDMVNKAPALMGWLYDYFDKPWKGERRRLAFDKLNTRPFVKMLKEHQPDVVICTHFLPAEIVSWLRAKEKIAAWHAIVVTDFDVHAMWLCRQCDHYFVGLDETRVHLEKLGIPPNKISVSGIPIDPVFEQKKDQRAMREKHGLRPERFTILVSAGGFGVGPLQNVMKVLLELRHPAQLVAVCGRNKDLKQQLDQLAAGISQDAPVAVKAVGYTSHMDEYMAASDLIVGKPGGLTTSEALAKGLVFVIVNPIPGQEERNSDHLLEEGVAIRCNNLPTLAHKIDRLLDDPARLKAMQGKTQQLAHPGAARHVIETLLKIKGGDGRAESFNHHSSSR
jgi:processive 1,2-diacylglycerol beta-glucosyltransferase